MFLVTRRDTETLNINADQTARFVDLDNTNIFELSLKPRQLYMLKNIPRRPSDKALRGINIYPGQNCKYQQKNYITF